MRIRRAIDRGSSLSWLAMDCLWASGHPGLAMTLALPTACLHAWPFPRGTTNSISSYIATMFWVLMNEAWMAEDSFGWPWATPIKFTAMYIAMAATMVWISTEIPWKRS